jgi:hypothetical protein
MPESSLTTWVLSDVFPPPCVAFSSIIEAVSAATGIRDTLLAAIAAQESGSPTMDDSQNRYQDGWPITHGVGNMQIDIGPNANPDYTAGLNPSANFAYGAKHFAGNLAQCNGDETQALWAYNTGSCSPSSTAMAMSAQLWSTNPSDLVKYPDSVHRHEKRIIDFKQVCSS